MVKTKSDPHKEAHYSMDHILKTAFEHEIRNHLSLSRKDDPRAEAVKSYLQERFEEIKERWK
jgi:hypothetical protein